MAFIWLEKLCNLMVVKSTFNFFNWGMKRHKYLGTILFFIMTSKVEVRAQRRVWLRRRAEPSAPCARVEGQRQQQAAGAPSAPFRSSGQCWASAASVTHSARSRGEEAGLWGRVAWAEDHGLSRRGRWKVAGPSWERWHRAVLDSWRDWARASLQSATVTSSTRCAGVGELAKLARFSDTAVGAGAGGSFTESEETLHRDTRMSCPLPETRNGN
jgi:hypothetical protein